MDAKEVPIEVGQVWRIGLGAEHEVIGIHWDNVTLQQVPLQQAPPHFTHAKRHCLRLQWTLVRTADGFTPWHWKGMATPIGEVDVYTRSGQFLAMNASQVDWSPDALDPVVRYRVVGRPEKSIYGETTICKARLSELTLAKEVLTDLGYTFAANCWVAPTPNPLTTQLAAVNGFKPFERKYHEPQPTAGEHDVVQFFGPVRIVGDRKDIDHVLRMIDKPALGGLDVHDIHYGKLAAVLNRAHLQASGGKGKERHANGLPFEEQPMASINKALGSVDGFIYQAHKKSLEAKRLPDGRAQAELLGAINYLAGAVIALDSWAKKADDQGF